MRTYDRVKALGGRLERAAEHMLSAPDTSWRDRALCKSTTTPDRFFPIDYESDESRAARFACRGCPVRRRCLIEGMAHRDGIWGGTTPLQRARMKGKVA